MHCTHCGSFVPDDETRCPECGTVFARKGRRKPIRGKNDNEVCSDGLVSGIVVTVLSLLCGCWGFGLHTGITSIVLSAVARQELNGKDMDRGIRIARYARIFRIITLILLALHALFPLYGNLLAEPLSHLFQWLGQTVFPPVSP